MRIPNPATLTEDQRQTLIERGYMDKETGEVFDPRTATLVLMDEYTPSIMSSAAPSGNLYTIKSMTFSGLLPSDGEHPNYYINCEATMQDATGNTTLIKHLVSVGDTMIGSRGEAGAHRIGVERATNYLVRFSKGEI